MKKKIVLMAALALGLMAGCSKNAADTATRSDANGYYCARCGLKFYTPRALFAEHCPQCKQTDILEVVGFVCASDGTVTLTPRGPEMVKCEKCGAAVSSLELPRAKELQSWGATLKTAGEVTR